ncbi:nucleoid-associated protein [uncultured Veillonella sp.]|uniref:nucleoid-associated protein n=1 Tax=uncultured Veillonella sp. TaxID=159268 RepID=UPI0025DF8FD5|nr:nucleoid-associated protein [uncultured Veillonella sp.]MDY3974089.1 nucleoid-associated protein [Veillonella caviae]
MQINKAVLQIFDFHSSLAVFSEGELELGEETIQDYISAHVEKAIKDPGLRQGHLNPSSPVGQLISKYRDGEVSIVELGKSLGETIFNFMKQATEPCLMDAIICEAAANHTYICVLLCQAHDGYTHGTMSGESGALSTKLVANRAVLPMPSQKLRSFLAINVEDFSVRLFEPKGEYDGEVTYILADRVLQIGTNPSSRDTVAKVRRIVDKVAKAHEGDGVAELVEVRSMISKNAEVSDTINPEIIVETVFAANPVQKEAAKQALAEQDMLRPLPVNREFAAKVGEKHKIKTDTGIEISFPVEYMKNSEFIEIVTNPDGTLRIELKNISKILNK